MSPTQITYIELYANDLEVIKEFYSKTFEWEFVDYGPTYTSFSKAKSGIDGGFEKTDNPVVNGALIVLHHDNLEEVIETVKENGGIIDKEIFSFPGGQRFEFIDPTGNKLAVWCTE